MTVVLGFPRTGTTMAFCLHKSGILHGNNIFIEIILIFFLCSPILRIREHILHHDKAYNKRILNLRGGIVIIKVFMSCGEVHVVQG